MADRALEASEYTAAREALRHAELELVEHQERVAAQRRALPIGPAVADYELLEAVRPGASTTGAPSIVRLSSLFRDPTRPLVTYHLMYGKREVTPCPMCTMWVDGLNGVALHVAQHADLAIVAAAGVVELRAHAERRGWDRLQVLSASTGTFKRDLGSEDGDGNQIPMVSVFTIDDDGTIRLRYSGTPRLSDTRPERGIDALCATWSVLDLLPEGRDDWYASLDYGA